jgi:tetratricopeptide (TPR) repeat protein
MHQMTSYFPFAKPFALICLWLLASCEKKSLTTAGEAQPDLAPPTRCGDPHRVLAANVRHLPAPPLRDGVGNASMTITTQNPQAQAYFDCGLNLLHAFWEFEAYRAFQRAVELDPDCAMGYWGIVMCMPGRNPEFLVERTNALARLAELRDRVSPREQAHIDALQILVSQGSDRFAERLEALWRSDPSDVDAGALAAYYFKDGYLANGQRTAKQQRGIQLIEDVLKRAPNHVGALHYAIHLYELGPEIDLAGPHAQRISKLAPRASHLVHMPGHVAFFRGDYEEAIGHFRAAYALDEAYHKAEGIDLAENENFAHNTNFLAQAYCEAGRLREALLYAEELKRTRLSTSRLRSEAASIVVYEGRSLSGKLLLRAGQYEKAAEAFAREAADLSPSVPRYSLQGLAAASRGLRIATTGQRDQLSIAVGEMARWTQLLNDAASRVTASEESFYAQRASQTLDLFARALRAMGASSLQTGRVFIEGLVEADGDAYRMDPPLLPLSSHELAGAFYLQRGDAASAKASYQKALLQRPRSGHVMLGLARAEKIAAGGTATEATRFAWNRVIECFPKADENLPAVIEAKAELAK